MIMKKIEKKEENIGGKKGGLLEKIGKCIKMKAFGQNGTAFMFIKNNTICLKKKWDDIEEHDYNI